MTAAKWIPATRESAGYYRDDKLIDKAVGVLHEQGEELISLRNQLQEMTEERDQMYDIAASNQEGHTEIDAVCNDLRNQLSQALDLEVLLRLENNKLAAERDDADVSCRDMQLRLQRVVDGHWRARFNHLASLLRRLYIHGM